MSWGKFYKKDDFSVKTIDDDYEIGKLEATSVNLSMDSNGKGTVELDILESDLTEWFFDSIKWIVIELSHDDGQVVTRKFFKVTFKNYQQEYQKSLGDWAKFRLIFLTDYFEIHQSNQLDSIEQFIRILKINQIVN